MSEAPTQEQRTPAIAPVIAAFRTLTEAEQQEALRACQRVWIQRLDGDESETALMIRSLARVARELGRTPGIEDYKRVRAELVEAGEELEPTSRILRHFHGSWHLAREALDLTEIEKPRRIQERFAKRRLGKVWRYTEETMRETILRAAREIGHAPQVAEFEWWRERQIELAKARGEDLHLPSPTPYRRRYGNWENALRHFGFSDDEIAGRLERG